jgi:hypothetical protein
VVVASETTPFGNEYLRLGEPLFPTDDSKLVEIASAGRDGVAPLPVQSLRPPPALPVAVSKPTAPSEGPMLVPSTQDLEIAWTAPAGNVADQRLLFVFQNLTGSLKKRASMYCSYPLSAGTARVPASLLAELRSRLGTSVTGQIHVRVGGMKQFAAPGVSYVVEVTRTDSTNLTEDYLAELQ